MANALSVNGAQSEKPTKAAPLYVGRIFSGIWTNRSPLRDANTTRQQEKWYGPSGDAMIAGSNVEVTNRLTLGRRPGNPIYSSIGYSDILAFDEFRYSKALPDIWGMTSEQIDVMVDTALTLNANNNGTNTVVQTKAAGAAQSFMQEVGTQLYFGDGIDQKKWNQSLFVRSTGNDSNGLNVAAYPFMSTNLIDSNGNIQQMIGCLIATISSVAIANNVLTVMLDYQLGDDVTQFPGMFDNPGGIQDRGTQFVLWGMQGTAAAFLNGLTITLNTPTTSGGTMLTADVTAPYLASTSVEGNGYVQIEAGIVSGLPNSLNRAVSITAIMPNPGPAGNVTNGAPGLTSGTAVPTWGTTIPAVANSFQGSITTDGNIIWVNRGIPTENWGIAAPSVAPTYTANGQVSGYVPDTYFSPASIYLDPNGNLYQITTPGKLRIGSAPAGGWPASPTAAKLTDVVTITVESAYSLVEVTFEEIASAFTVGEIITMQNLVPTSFLNGVPLTVVDSGTLHASDPTTTSFWAVYAYATSFTAPQTAGTILYGGTIVADGAANWTCIQLEAVTHAWQADYAYQNGTYIQAPNGPGGQPAFWLLRTNQANNGTGQPAIVGTNIPAPIVYGYNKHITDGNFSVQGAPSPTDTYDWTSGTPSYNGNKWQSLLFDYYQLNNQYLWNTPISGNNVVGTPYQVNETGSSQFAVVVPLFIPAAGPYTFSMDHVDGGFFGFETDAQSGGGTASRTTGTFLDSQGLTGSAYLDIPSSQLAGTNNFTAPPSPGSVTTDISTWTFTAPGIYMLEIDWCAGSPSSGGPPSPSDKMYFTCNSTNIAIQPQVSGTTASFNPPGWGPFVAAGTNATWNAAQDEIYFGVTAPDSGGQWVWNNIGLVSNFVRNPDGVYYTLPGQIIVDTNSSEEGAYCTGITGNTAPTWTGSLNTVTLDPNVPLSWINEGTVPTPAISAGKISAFSKQGWIWALALVNTLDNTVSNIGPVSLSSGPVTNASPTFAPGSGLNAASIDPQADYVAIFRTADGFSTELLIPGDGNTIYTVPLSQYLLNGYIDTTLDTLLDSNATAPQAYENTPPLPGAINLTYHLNRLFYSIGNTVFWTSGPDAPIGNGINGFAPDNYDTMPSLVKRLVPTSLGLMVFTVSDIYMIPDNGQGQLEPSYVYAPGIGISSYNALDWNGPTIGFFTTDSQFLTFSPANGAAIVSVPIADQFALKGGPAGQNWYPANVYVANYVSGQDMGWFVADGTNGWYRLINNPTPEVGMSWSPFATLANTGGCGAIKSVETSPGVHMLLSGPRGTGVKIQYRNVFATTDGGTENGNGTAYPAFAVFGSYVLAQPGQVALVQFVTTKSVLFGSPLVLGLLLDDALPYYKGSFEILKTWVNDPPTLKPSRTWYTQRFYLSDMPTESAAVTDMQLLIQWPAESALNELQAFSIFGSYVQEA